MKSDRWPSRCKLTMLLGNKCSWLNLLYAAPAASFFVLLFSSCFLNNSAAAEIDEYPDNNLNCILKLQGTIETGDAEKLIEKLHQFAEEKKYNVTVDSSDLHKGMIWVKGIKRICLDSSGGSFAEALKIADVIYSTLGTAIEKRASCLSACALAFMAGSYNTMSGEGIVLNRVMEVGGQLGFHAPDLVVAAGQYTQEQVNKAYRVSVAATGALSRRMQHFRFSLSLLTEMYSTPPGEMFYIDYVAQAARWRISIAGVDMPLEINPRQISHACVNAYRAAGDRGDFGTGDVRRDIFGTPPISKFTQQLRGFKAEDLGYGEEHAGLCTIKYNGKPAVQPKNEKPYEFYFRAALLGYNLGSVEVDGNPSITIPLEPWLLYPGSMKIKDLAASAQTQFFNPNTICAVYSGNKKIDEEECTFSESFNTDGFPTWTFTWPSGSQTVITHDTETALKDRSIFPDKMMLNGKEAIRQNVVDRYSSKGQYSQCFLNSATGNTFCYRNTDLWSIYKRDVTHNDDSDGHVGFRFTKLDANGADLPDAAETWFCVRDNATRLIWEVKTEDGGLRDRDWDYTWYNPDSARNGGDAGAQDGGDCEGSPCDTQGFVDAVNAQELCGAGDWRLPKVEELRSIVSDDRGIPKIDVDYFPNAMSLVTRSWFWSASPHAYNSYHAWLLDFYYGNAYSEGKNYAYRVRLVRDGQ